LERCILPAKHSQSFSSEPPRTRTWNLEIESLSTRGCSCSQLLKKYLQIRQSFAGSIARCSPLFVTGWCTVGVHRCRCRSLEGDRRGLNQDLFLIRDNSVCRGRSLLFKEPCKSALFFLWLSCAFTAVQARCRQTVVNCRRACAARVMRSR
jgi:hypothetical protein